MEKKRGQESIRLDTEGNWYHGDFPILHDRTVQFLNKNIVLDSNGRFYLTGEDKPVPLVVEDAPYWIIKMEKTIAGYLVTLSDETIELLDSESLWIGKNEALYCVVKGGTLPAKFNRPTHFEMSKSIQQKGTKFVFEFRGKVFPISPKAPQLVEKIQLGVRKPVVKTGGGMKSKRVKHVSPPKKAAKKKSPAKKSPAKKSKKKRR